MNFEGRCVIYGDHPSLPGHFPGAPIVPGVVILDEVLAALFNWRKDSHPITIRAAKFLAPLKPEQPFTIALSPAADRADEIDFRCRIDNLIIAEGRLQIAQPS